MARNAGVHAAGVVISPQPLKDLVPLYKTNKDEIVTQYDMSGLEKLGLLKMDFLGLTTLTLIHDAVALIEKHRETTLLLEDVPLDDPKTYEIFGRGFTSGIFQFESEGMRDILRRYQPSRIEDLCALNALYRPGPIQGGMIDDFIERKHGRKQVSYEIAELKPILEETYGVIVYQEQVMQIANRLAGYSLGEADLLRRAMGKKKPEEMAKQRERFLQGALERGHNKRKVEKLFELMEQFAGYGFNKSHSAAYAYLAYVTAYLKANYPLDFMAALLTSETGTTAKVVKYINECREMGIRVLPPDVNASDWSFTPDGDAIRFGLGAIKSLGQSAVEAILAARQERGPFRSLYDFCERVDLGNVNRRMIESLIKAGAMDSLAPVRAQLFAAVDRAMDAGQKAWRDRVNGQAGLFAMEVSDGAPPEKPLPKLPEWSLQEKLSFEKEVLGFYVTGHPLEHYRDKVKDLASHTTAGLEGLERSAEVSLCGILTGVQRRRNKEGKLWAAMQLEDMAGSIDAVLFTTNYERLLDQLVEDKAVLVKATVLPEESGPPKISVQDIIPMEVAGVQYPTLISIRVPLGKRPEAAGSLWELFARKSGDTAVRLRLEKAGDFSLVLDLSEKVRPDREFRQDLERICGPGSYEVLAR
jgi:DNA polymerase-3 subunit alpha